MLNVTSELLQNYCWITYFFHRCVVFIRYWSACTQVVILWLYNYCYRYRTGWDFVVLTAEMLFIMVYLCQAHFYVIIIMQLRKRYFSQIWNILDIFYLLIALSYIVIYIYRHAVSTLIYISNQLTMWCTVWYIVYYWYSCLGIFSLVTWPRGHMAVRSQG